MVVSIKEKKLILACLQIMRAPDSPTKIQTEAHIRVVKVFHIQIITRMIKGITVLENRDSGEINKECQEVKCMHQLGT